MTTQQPTSKQRRPTVTRLEAKAIDRSGEDIVTIKRMGAVLLLLGALAAGIVTVINLLL